MKHLNEWRIFKKKKEEEDKHKRIDLEEFEGYKVGDWIHVDERDDEMRGNWLSNRIMIITGIRKYGIGRPLIDVRFPEEENGYTVDFTDVVRKLSPEEIEQYKLSQETDKYNL